MQFAAPISVASFARRWLQPSSNHSSEQSSCWAAAVWAVVSLLPFPWPAASASYPTTLVGHRPLCRWYVISGLRTYSAGAADAQAVTWGQLGAGLCAACAHSCLGNGKSHSPGISLKELAGVFWKAVWLEKADLWLKHCMAAVRQRMLIPWKRHQSASANSYSCILETTGLSCLKLWSEVLCLASMFCITAPSRNVTAFIGWCIREPLNTMGFFQCITAKPPVLSNFSLTNCEDC